MPATIIYKPGYPNTSAPVETSASVGQDGLVTGSALFVCQAATNAYQVNSQVNSALFSSLAGVRLQGLFVESRSLEKRGGLHYLQIGVVGAVNPPIINRAVDVETKGFSKTENFGSGDDEVALTLSFSYMVERTSASVVLVDTTSFAFAPASPRILQIFNPQGPGRILDFSIGSGLGTIIGPTIFARPRIFPSENRSTNGRIVRIEKSLAIVYE